MTFWNIGDEEADDPRFEIAGDRAFEMYHKAGAWCMGRVRGQSESKIPVEWFIPDTFVRSQRSGTRTAKGLVEAGMWERVEHGYRFAWIRPSNTADSVRRRRKLDRANQHKTRRKP